MRKDMDGLVWMFLGLFLAGCSTVGELKEPTEIPSLVTSYQIEGLNVRTGNVPTVLDLNGCAESAILSSVGLSGVPSVAGTFPIRRLVEREFQKVVVGNFRTVMPEEEPKLELSVTSRKVAVRRSWSRVTAEMDFEVRLLDPQRAARPCFRKEYHVNSESVQRSKDEMPICVYSCVQNLARKFLEDVSKDALVVARLRALGD